MKIFKAFKSIVQHITPFTSRDESKLYRACMDGDLDTVQHLFENKKLRYLNMDIDSLIQNTCRDGHSNVIEYLLTSAHTKEFHYVNWTRPLSIASSSGKLDIVKFFLNSSKYEDYINENIINEHVLKPACESLKFDIVNYLIDSPKFSQITDIHFENDLLFQQAFNNHETEFLQHLIFDLNLKETANIIYFLHDSKINNQENDYSIKIKNMFQIRGLNSQLQNELNIKQDKINKKNQKI